DVRYRIEAARFPCGEPVLVCGDRPRVVHPAPPGRFGVSLRLQRYSVCNALMFKKHPARYRRELQRWPPFHYYAMVALAAASAGALLAGRRRTAAACALGSAALQ